MYDTNGIVRCKIGINRQEKGILYQLEQDGSAPVSIRAAQIDQDLKNEK